MQYSPGQPGCSPLLDAGVHLEVRDWWGWGNAGLSDPGTVARGCAIPVGLHGRAGDLCAFCCQVLASVAQDEVRGGSNHDRFMRGLPVRLGPCRSCLYIQVVSAKLASLARLCLSVKLAPSSRCNKRLRPPIGR